MVRRTRFASMAVLCASAALVACSDADESGEGGGGADATTASTGGPTSTAGPSTTTASSSSTGSGSGTQSFHVTIENVSGNAAIPSPISPGFWALHADDGPLFTAGQPDRGEGLERIAEDGNPMVLAASFDADANAPPHGVFDMPMGETSAGPAKPGQSFELDVPVDATMPRLSFAMMFGQSNDVFIGPNEAGIALFDDENAPIASQDVTAQVSLWDAGTEVNQAPGEGPLQAPRQSAPEAGPGEGVLGPLVDSTRALPHAAQIAKVEVTAITDGFSVTVRNVSGPGSAASSPISPVFFAVHDDSWALFHAGLPNGGSGLERLAEDGNPGPLVDLQSNATGVLQASSIAVADGAQTAGPAAPGQSFTFTVHPDASHPLLSIASMVGQSNDAFLAFDEKGVALLDATGAPRPAAEIEADFDKRLAIWDAGTEANEVPGAGPSQAARQLAPDTGAPDPDDTVRRYADWTNDLAGPLGGGVASVSVETSDGNVVVTFGNTSGATRYPTALSPVVYALHDGTLDFLPAGAASEGIEHLAEDGNGTVWAAALGTDAAVTDSGIVNVAVGASSAGPIASGHAFQIVVHPDATARYLSFASMVGTSNDTFLAVDGQGVMLADASGALRSPADIESDLTAAINAWDAGTEANQASAIGPDQGPRQAAPNTGASEGDGVVRDVATQVWRFPKGPETVRVKIELVETN